MNAVTSSLVSRLRGLLACAAAALALLGCASAKRAVVYTPAPPLPSYHDLREGVPFRRIVMLPLYQERDPANPAGGLDEAFHAELTKTTLFEVVWISRLQLEEITGRAAISSAGILPRELLPQLAARYGADAVLFTDVTHYFPYQPISVGIRAKLVDIHTGEIRWSFDHLFDSGKPAVAIAARHFYLANSQPNLPICNDGNTVLESPMRFGGYAAWETYRSLLNKPRTPARESADEAKVVLNSVN